MKGSDVALAAIGVGVAGGVVAAVYYSFNAGPPGGSCDCAKDPNSPCCAALAPYEQTYQSCLSQYTQLWSQIVKGGQAPTASQQADLDSLKACMDQAAKDIATTASQYIPQNSIASLIDDIGEAIIVVAAGVAVAYGLKGFGSFLSSRRAGGQVKTGAGNPAGIAALMSDGIVQYASANALITAESASAFTSSLDVNASNDLFNLGEFYDSLVAEQVFSQSFATTQINSYTSTINADAETTIAELPF